MGTEFPINLLCVLFSMQSHASLTSHNQDIKISVIGADHKKRVIIDDNTYTLSEPTVFQGPGT